MNRFISGATCQPAVTPDFVFAPQQVIHEMNESIVVRYSRWNEVNHFISIETQATTKDELVHRCAVLALTQVVPHMRRSRRPWSRMIGLSPPIESAMHHKRPLVRGAGL